MDYLFQKTWALVCWKSKNQSIRSFFGFGGSKRLDSDPGGSKRLLIQTRGEAWEVVKGGGGVRPLSCFWYPLFLVCMVWLLKEKLAPLAKLPLRPWPRPWFVGKLMSLGYPSCQWKNVERSLMLQNKVLMQSDRNSLEFDTFTGTITQGPRHLSKLKHL